MAQTKIEWTATRGPDGAMHPGYTFNPWWGCTKVSPACTNCYAASFDKRVGGSHWGPKAPRRFFGEKHWNQPRKWNERARKLGVRLKVFCASMADVFEIHDDRETDVAMEGERMRLERLIEETPHLDWLLLTKRPENIIKLCPTSWWSGMHNVWLGTTTENDPEALIRIPDLLRHSWAARRFISYEPALGSLCLTAIEVARAPDPRGDIVATLNALTGHVEGPDEYIAKIDWVIAGSESGGKARRDPQIEDWYRSVRDQCESAGVPFFLKQDADRGRKISLPVLDGRQHAEMPA